MELAVRELNISYMEARSMLVWEFQMRMEGIYERELSEWKRTRWLATWIVKPYKKDVEPSDLLPLPDDIRRKKIPEGHFERMLENYRKYHAS